MADGVTLDPGTGGDIIAADDLGATGKAQWVKLRDGTDGGTQTIASGGGTETAALRVTLASDSTGLVSVDDNGGSLTVDGTVTVQDGGSSITVDNGGTFAVQADTELPAAGALADDTANPTTSVIGSFLHCFDGTNWDRARGDTTNGIDVDVTRVGGNVTVVNGGTFATQENGGALTALQLLDDTVFADDAAFTVGTSKVSAIGLMADQASTDSVNEGDVGIPRMTLDRKQIITVAPSADTEGLSVSNNIDIDESEDAVKASAGKLYGWYLYNDGATEVYVKFYNDTVANVTVGTTAPHMTIPVPAGAAANVEFTNGIAFSAAITVAATTGVATADTGAPAANQVVGCILYQ